MYSEAFHKSLLFKIRSLVGDYQWAIEGILSDKLLWRPEEKEWSAHEVLSHVRAVQREVYGLRVRRILNEERPQLVVWDEKKWHDEHWDKNEPVKKMLDEFASEISEITGTLIRSQDWQRIGIHPELGPTSLEYWILRMYNHAVEHLHQIMKIHAELLRQELVSQKTI